MQMATPCSIYTLVKASLVNWQPWSVLNISGVPYFCKAASRHSTQKRLSRVFDTRQVKTLRDHGRQKDKTSFEANIGDVGAPDLVGVNDGYPPEQVRINLMLRMGATGIRTRSYTGQAQNPHSLLDAFPIVDIAKTHQKHDHSASTKKRVPSLLCVDCR
jgi:hypothetical protein